MRKMNAITFTKTGHLLGVVTRASQPEKAATPEEVVAGGFKLRSSDDSNIILEIPEDEISVVLVDYDTRVLYRPHLFALENGRPEQQMDENDGPNSLEATLTGGVIEVTIPNPVSEHTEVWCQVSGGFLSEPVVRPVKIKGDDGDPLSTDSEPLFLSAGDYKVVMFAPGYIPVVSLITVA